MTWLQKDRGAIPTIPLKSVRQPGTDNARERVLTGLGVRFLLLGAQAKGHRASWLPDASLVLLRSAITEWAATAVPSIHVVLLISGHRDTEMLSRFVNMKASDSPLRFAGITSPEDFENLHE
jgi:hypothetical protein